MATAADRRLHQIRFASCVAELDSRGPWPRWPFHYAARRLYSEWRDGPDRYVYHIERYWRYDEQGNISECRVMALWRMDAAADTTVPVHLCQGIYTPDASHPGNLTRFDTTGGPLSPTLEEFQTYQALYTRWHPYE